MRYITLLFLVFLTGCPEGPRVAVCVSSADVKHGFDCVDKDGKPFELKYERSLNWVAMSPSDTRTLLEYCKLKQEDDE